MDLPFLLEDIFILAVQPLIDLFQQRLIIFIHQVYLSGIPDEGTLDVRWTQNNLSRRCAVHFHLSSQQQQNNVKTFSGFCQ